MRSSHRLLIGGKWVDAQSAAVASKFKRVTGYLEAGRQQGAKVVTDGGRIGDQGYFAQPTVLTDTKPGTSVVRERDLRPRGVRMPFDNDEAIEL